MTFNQRLVKRLALVVLCFTVLSFNTPLGLDSYEIYLNKRLLLKQAVNQPLNLRMLQLDEALESDQLRIYYRHCTLPGAGTDRSVMVKDENGKIFKKWTFANTTGSDLSMTIPVRELLQLKKEHAKRELSLHYAAKELMKGETLAFLQF